MANIQQTIYLSNEGQDVDWENQYVFVELEDPNNQFDFKVLDVYTLYGDKYEVSTMTTYESECYFKDLIDDRVRYVIANIQQSKSDNYEEIHGIDEDVVTIFEPLKEDA